MDEQQSVIVFTAALQGICANEYFFGPTMQQSPEAAVTFAYKCVKACCRESDGSIDFSASRFPAEEMSETLEARAKETERKANAHASLTEAVRVLTEALEALQRQALQHEWGLEALQMTRAALTTAKELTK